MASVDGTGTDGDSEGAHSHNRAEWRGHNRAASDRRVCL
jgi:hypothetical protein